MSGHTPGPWKQSHRKGKDGMHRTEVYDREGGVIATCAWYPVPYVLEDGTKGTRTAREANARLIAAAPAMYEALQQITHWTGEIEIPAVLSEDFVMSIWRKATEAMP